MMSSRFTWSSFSPPYSWRRSAHGVVRVVFTGETPLAWRLHRDADLMKAELQHHGARLGGLWIESLEVRCNPARSTTAMLSEACEAYVVSQKSDRWMAGARPP